MKLSRRELVKFGGVSALQGLLASVPGCNSGKPLPRLLRSNVPLPKKFEAELPRLSVLKPTVTSGVEDRYELRACVSTAKILSDQRTAIWGLDGMFPGPIGLLPDYIEAHNAREISARMRIAKKRYCPQSQQHSRATVQF